MSDSISLDIPERKESKSIFVFVQVLPNGEEKVMGAQRPDGSVLPLVTLSEKDIPKMKTQVKKMSGKISNEVRLLEFSNRVQDKRIF